MTWYDENAGEKQIADEWLAETFPGEVTSIVATFDIAWSGWDAIGRGHWSRTAAFLNSSSSTARQ